MDAQVTLDWWSIFASRALDSAVFVTSWFISVVLVYLVDKECLLAIPCLLNSREPPCKPPRTCTDEATQTAAAHRKRHSSASGGV